MGKVLFVIGVVSEWSRPPAATPQYRRWPFIQGERYVAMQLSATQQVRVSAQFLDKHGNPAQVESCNWLTDNSDVLALTPSGDGLSCLVAARGPMGAARLTLSGDADMGEGVIPIIGTLDFEVTAGQASQVALEAGTPEEQPTRQRGK